MDDNGELKEDLNLPDEVDLRKKLLELVEKDAESKVRVMSAIGEEKIVGVREVMDWVYKLSIKRHRVLRWVAANS